ncbi:zinc finger and SCAN domain-containing protein 5A-like isoform X4 [Gigantopelta aegis]|uniref:zinc finger and SCAN domain-containing protein 5A-like isoform X4 n=1 Tax=Gigantopelta aegis TaxID=1735272 RepID=UPI001B8893E7|nr:zinc finger and SCAN domain-containing protein 5A-like isoform X4 [Gigantopelta aegis]
MDKQYSVKFFTSFVEAMQKFCREYIDFEQCVELSGYLAVEIDNHKKERYVLSEMLQSSGNVISESYCTKAFKTLRKEPSVSARGSENKVPSGALRTSQSHADEVTIVLRDSPDMVTSHASTPRHQRFSSHRSGAFNHGQRGYSSSGLSRSPVHGRESIKLGNPFEQQLRHVPDQIQPRSIDSSSRNDTAFSSSPASGQKRTSIEFNHQQGSPAAKRDKVDPGSSPADVSSMRTVYSEGGDSSLTQQQTSSLSFPSPSSSQATGESIRLPLSATVKEEDVSSVISLDTQDNVQDPTDSDFGDRLQDSLSLGLDSSVNYSNSSQGVIDDGSQSATAGSSGFMSQFKMGTVLTVQPSADTSHQGSSSQGQMAAALDPRTDTFYCSICEKHFSEIRYLKQHKETHTSERFSCQFCGSTYSMKSNLCRHAKKCKLRLGFDT